MSTAIMQFEMFLANNVKFGSLNEVVTFIDNIKREKRKYKDSDLLDKNITAEDCFAKIVMTCGFRWVPNEDEMEIIWKIINNLSQEDINRVYYKNNLYEFMSNTSMIKSLKYIIKKLEVPYVNPLKVPSEIKSELDEFTNILKEYVYYGYMIIDRIDRNINMVKSICLISDTDSAIISLDGWYRFALENLKGEDFNILHEKIDPIKFFELDEFGDITGKEDYRKAITFVEPELDFNFYEDEIIEKEYKINPIQIIPQDNLRYSIINIMAYVLDNIVNDYLVTFSKQNHTYRGEGKCKLILKNEFLLRRVLMTDVKKSYATLQELQEGNKIPKGIDTELDIKGIASMAKSSMSDYTRRELKKIMYEDILNTSVIDQLTIAKHIAILEKKIMRSLFDGSKDYYKPVVMKSMDSYDDPMSQQGIKASIVWNALRDDDMGIFNLKERNSMDIAKVDINTNSIEKIKDKYPDLYDRCSRLLKDKYFLGGINSIGIPSDEPVPVWLSEFIDYKAIVNDNISGFPLEAVGSMRLNNSNVNYTNILKL